MTKNYLLYRLLCRIWCQELFKYMLLTLLFIFLALAVNAQNQKVSLSVKNASIKEVLEEVRKQTGLRFIFNNDEILKLDKKNTADRITLNVKNVSVKNVLDSIFTKTDMRCKFQDNVIMIVKRETSEKVKLKGKVLDDQEQPLPGASVIATDRKTGRQFGVATDITGDYEISFEKGDVLLEFAYIGMKVVNIPYENQSFLVVNMAADSEEIGEVVVTGYRKVEKRKLTSSIATIKGEEVVEPVTLSVDKMLQGKIAGVKVMGQSSTPGATTKIRIRGTSSISGNREPIWVLNGIILQDPVPISAQELNNIDRVNLVGNAISSINPQDIERIDILKDASATAIYGSKASNGVIVITTKEGKLGKPRINFNSSVSVTAKPLLKTMHRMNAAERLGLSMEIQEKGLHFVGKTVGKIGYEKLIDDLWKRKITPDQYLAAAQRIVDNSTDWYDELFRNSVSQNQTLSVSGANERTSYYFSLGYGKNSGTTKGVDLNRYGANVKINTKFNDRLKFGFSLNASNSKNERFNSNVDPYKYAYETSPLIPLYNKDGSYYFYAVADSYGSRSEGVPTYPLKYNILHEKEHGGSEIENTSISFSSYLDYKVASWLRFNTTFGYNMINTNQQSWADAESHDVTLLRGYPYGKPLPENDEFRHTVSRIPYGGYLQNTDTRGASYTFRNSLSANKSWGDHNTSAVFGCEFNSSTYKGFYAKELGYLPDRGRKFVMIEDLIWKKYFREKEGSKASITDRVSNFMSYYATFTYAYSNKYIFNFNVRADASNKFGQSSDARFLPIYSFSGRWNIYEEGWLKDSKWINQLSLRASYGTQGNVSMEHSPYTILRRGSLDANSGEYIATLDRLPNPGLKWEKTSSFNLGLDFSLFNNFLYGNVELYYRKGTDQIIKKEITPTNGMKAVSINRGDIENRGWELSLNMNPINTEDWGLGISFNTGKNYNEVTNSGLSSYDYNDYINGTIIKDGEAVNTFYSYKFDKLDEKGLPTFKDLCEFNEKGERVINSKEELFDQIFAVSGTREPTLAGGFSASLRYKSLSLNANFSFSMGAKERLNNLYESDQRLPVPQQNLSSEFVDRWRKPGDEAHTNIPGISTNTLGYLQQKKTAPDGRTYFSKYSGGFSYWTMYNASDLRVVSKDFLRCRSLSLSYNLPETLCERISMRAISLSFTTSNLFVLKDPKLKGRDPEQIKLGAGVIPPQRTYSFGVNINF